MPKTLKTFVEDHEGRRLETYRDTREKATVGVGHNLEDNDLPNYIVEALFTDDLLEATYDLLRILIGENRAKALIDMRFQLGPKSFRSFQLMLEAVHKGNWHEASREALDSIWAWNFPERAIDIAEMLREG